MDINAITQLFLNFFPFGFLKLMIVSLLAIYLIFAGIIVRQETLMARVVEIPFSPLLRFITIIHLIATIIVTALATVLL